MGTRGGSQAPKRILKAAKQPCLPEGVGDEELPLKALSNSTAGGTSEVSCHASNRGMQVTLEEPSQDISHL